MKLLIRILLVVLACIVIRALPAIPQERDSWTTVAVSEIAAPED